MSAVRRTILYFEKSGSSNTVALVEAVEQRLRLGDVKLVVVPVTTGKTADMFSLKLRDKAEIVRVSEDEAALAAGRIAERYPLARVVQRRLESSLFKGRLETSTEQAKRLRREAFDMTFLPFAGESWDVIRQTLYAFGQGMKVAIEVSVLSVEINKVKPYVKVIAIGGTDEGSDTAIVARTSPQREAFGSDVRKRLSVEEILAMPIEKA